MALNPKCGVWSCGRVIHSDQGLLQALPSEVDPCGENGEFHTFVYDAPVFAYPIKIAMGEVVERDGFVFADLSLGDGGAV